MRGFLFGCLLLVGLDLIVQAPASQVTGLLTPVTGLVQRWLDPSVPLIGQGHLAASGAGNAKASSSGIDTTGLLGRIAELSNPLTAPLAAAP